MQVIRMLRDQVMLKQQQGMREHVALLKNDVKALAAFDRKIVCDVLCGEN